MYYIGKSEINRRDLGVTKTTIEERGFLAIASWASRTRRVVRGGRRED